jgi:hypothetical protein
MIMKFMGIGKGEEDPAVFLSKIFREKDAQVSKTKEIIKKLIQEEELRLQQALKDKEEAIKAYEEILQEETSCSEEEILDNAEDTPNELATLAERKATAINTIQQTNIFIEEEHKRQSKSARRQAINSIIKDQSQMNQRQMVLNQTDYNPSDNNISLVLSLLQSSDKGNLNNAADLNALNVLQPFEEMTSQMVQEEVADNIEQESPFLAYCTRFIRIFAADE